MRHRLRLTNQENLESTAQDAFVPEPILFDEARRNAGFLFPFRQSDDFADDVLRSLDELSTSLDDLRREIDSLDDDAGPTPAA